MPQLPKIIVIVGTNASGKSGLGVELAKRYNGEIVSADSRQVFQGLDLGSGKITKNEMKGIPHHLLDVRKAGDFFSMADFQRMAYEAIDGILARGRLPFLVGGTGLYVESVVEGYLLSGKTPDLRYRMELEKLDTDTLYAMLTEAVPDARVDPRNRNRVMRLLERAHAGDVRPQGRERRYDSLRLGVTWERGILCERIDERLRLRMANGMLEEVRGLLRAGVSEDFLIGLGLEYRFLTRCLKGEYTNEEEMLALLSTAIKQFAKRQMTWFRRDTGIRWLDMAGDPVAEAMGEMEGFLLEGCVR